MSTVSDTTDATFDADVLSSQTPVLVDFWAPWCGPCRAMAPILDEIASEHGDKLKVVKLNTDDNPSTTARYGITSIPQMNVYVAGELVKSITSAKPKQIMLRELADFIS